MGSKKIRRPATPKSRKPKRKQPVTARARAGESGAFLDVYYRHLFENSPEGIVSLDKSGLVIDANHSFLRLFGYSLTEIKGQQLIDVPYNLELETLNSKLP